MRNAWLAVLALCVAFGAFSPVDARATAQPSFQEDEEFPDPVEVFDRHLEALGGEDAIRSVTSRRLKGTVSIRSTNGGVVKGFLVVEGQAPNMARVEQDFPGVGFSVQVYDGEVGWVHRPNSGYSILEGEALDSTIESAAFYGEADYETMYTSLKTIGWTRVGEIEKGVVLEGIRKSGTIERLVFDDATGRLELVERFSKPDEYGERSRVSMKIHDDWKEFDGILYPTTVTDQRSTGTVTITLTEIEMNPEPAPDFTRPPEVVSLLEEADETEPDGG